MYEYGTTEIKCSRVHVMEKGVYANYCNGPSLHDILGNQHEPHIRLKEQNYQFTSMKNKECVCVWEGGGAFK